MAGLRSGFSKVQDSKLQELRDDTATLANIPQETVAVRGLAQVAVAAAFALAFKRRNGMRA